MWHYLITHWPIVLIGLMMLGGGASYESSDDDRDDDDWHAHPMNKVGMNYMGD